MIELMQAILIAGLLALILALVLGWTDRKQHERTADMQDELMGDLRAALREGAET